LSANVDGTLLQPAVRLTVRDPPLIVTEVAAATAAPVESVTVTTAVYVPFVL